MLRECFEDVFVFAEFYLAKSYLLHSFQLSLGGVLLNRLGAGHVLVGGHTQGPEETVEGAVIDAEVQQL